jgi:hypothetical protein
MSQLKALLVACAGVGAALVATPAVAAEALCTPTEVAVFLNRIHVRCEQPTRDGNRTIWFFAVPTSNAQRANRFLSTATTALVASRTLRFHYDAGNTSGAAFGCLAFDCRVADTTILY